MIPHWGIPPSWFAAKVCCGGRSLVEVWSSFILAVANKFNFTQFCSKSFFRSLGVGWSLVRVHSLQTTLTTFNSGWFSIVQLSLSDDFQFYNFHFRLIFNCTTITFSWFSAKVFGWSDQSLVIVGNSSNHQINPCSAFADFANIANTVHQRCNDNVYHLQKC